jgi:hypothetical protein
MSSLLKLFLSRLLWRVISFEYTEGKGPHQTLGIALQILV